MKPLKTLMNDFLKLIAAAVIVFIFIILIFWFIGYYGEDEEMYVEDTQEEQAEEECNVSGIELRGDLVTYISAENYDAEDHLIVDQVASEEIVWAINNAKDNDSIKAIIIEVDSYGGMPTAGEEINSSVTHSEKPIVVYIRSAGISAAYWAISGADHIIALPSSDIGSIGVTNSYVDNVNRNSKEGFTYNQLSTGKYKDVFDPNKPLTNEEKELIMRDLDLINENFIQTVSENRNIDIDSVRAMADGSSMLSQMALNSGLIDQIGAGHDVVEYLGELIGEDAEICW